MKRLLLIVGVLGCASVSGGAGDDLRSERCETGRLITRGPDPSVDLFLNRDGESPLRLSAGSGVALRALAEGMVTVCGSGGTPMEVTSVVLREMDGMPAYAGALMGATGRWTLAPREGEPGIALVDVSPALAEAAGQEVWVAGEWSGDAFRVQSFGMISPP